MTRLTFSLAVLGLVAACGPVPVSEERQAAEQAAKKVVEDTYGVTNSDAMANCVVRNALEDEIIGLQLGGLVARDTVSFILPREGTQSCLKRNNIVLAEAT